MTDKENGRLVERDKRDAELIHESGENGDDEKLPPPSPVIREMLAMFGFGPGGRAFHPVFDKFESGHVDKFLDHSHAEDMERLRIQKRGHWFVFVYIVLALLSFGWLISTLLPENKDLLVEILKIGVAFAGGVGGGYGLKSYQESRQRR